MGTEYIIDCAGNKIPVGDALFSAKCWVGNSKDYLEANSDHVIQSLVDHTPLPKVILLVPIYRAGENFLPTLKSLCKQNWSEPNSVEIVLYVNQPKAGIEDLTQKSIDAAEDFIRENENSVNMPCVKVVFEKLQGGLAEVYQRFYTTLVARVKLNIDKRQLTGKETNAQAIGELMDSTVFAVVDDDQVLCDTHTFPTAVGKLKAGESVIMGQVEITKVVTKYTDWDLSLTGIMNMFFKLKYELGSVILTPRALIASDLFHMPAVKIGNEYADQIWFAAASAKKERYMIDVTTTLEEETYPSNAQMVTRIGHYLETGEGNDSLNIFRNLLSAYKNSTENLLYTFTDLIDLIATLESRNKSVIDSKVKELLNKKNIKDTP